MKKLSKKFYKELADSREEFLESMRDLHVPDLDVKRMWDNWRAAVIHTHRTYKPIGDYRKLFR
jgi:hypothetical protein